MVGATLIVGAAVDVAEGDAVARVGVTVVVGAVVVAVGTAVVRGVAVVAGLAVVVGCVVVIGDVVVRVICPPNVLRHVVRLSFATVCAGQRLQNRFPAMFWNCPVGHSLQLWLPRAWNEPAAQRFL